MHIKAQKDFKSGYPGINWMKAIACNVVYWHNIDSDIEKIVESCIPCLEAPKNPPQIVNTHWIYPEKPWSQIHVDFADLMNGFSFLVIVDAHS